MLDRAGARALGETVFDTLADLHSIDVVAAGLADLGKGPGYVRRQVGGWSGRFRAARTDDVPDGEAALQYLFADGDASRPLPALIYLDCEMPRLDGVTLLTIIRRDPRLRAIPTVMLTGVADEAEMRRATDYGASAYIVKPADAAELVRVIAASAAHWLRSYGKQAA